MTTLKVPDMHCQKCVARITAAMEAANISCTISLEAQTVSVEEDNIPQAIEELDDLGFDVAE